MHQKKPQKGDKMNCQLCGEIITDKKAARTVLPWGETCGDCVKKIYVDPALNCECGFQH
jgi:hypothetical protein